MFDCGGLAIGVPLSHKVVDGFVIFTFFQAWVAACCFGNTTEVVTCPSFKMGSLLPARDTDKLKILVPEEYGVTMVTKRFVFDELAISTLKAKAKAIGEVSRVVVMTVVLWKARILAVIAQFKTSECKLDFNDLVALLGNSIRETAADCLKTEDADDLFTLMISSMREIHEILEKNETDICVFTSVCGFPYYEVDFG
ncbi:acetyl-CoA-benzylalcohol acetyltransferase-like [Citrus sinensis]|uniref:acetyl-CoA-benzylalcohol acetyltransferase-like n=1 Tax=Citrus sinensis TaxID=2711 RepID=UPI000CED3E6F|nr:acetyl-CoA-benzylalcohol acetyltransferase-like [Citrus sinensis]XP_024035570.1 acetyl-CoA-benzylalcohol acetyltransferase [Citrus x clementina]